MSSCHQFLPNTCYNENYVKISYQNNFQPFKNSILFLLWSESGCSHLLPSTLFHFYALITQKAFKIYFFSKYMFGLGMYVHLKCRIHLKRIFLVGNSRITLGWYDNENNHLKKCCRGVLREIFTTMQRTSTRLK